MATIRSKSARLKICRITHTKFKSSASAVYGESSAFKSEWKGTDELVYEMAALAYVYIYRNQKAFGIDSDQANIYRNTNIYKQTDDMRKTNWSLINAIRGGNDYSNGADYWDGAEQAMYPESVTTLHPSDRPSWRLHMNETGWKISDEHYAKWKKNLGSIFKAPQVRVATVGSNKGKIRYISTAVYARTIFWREI